MLQDFLVIGWHALLLHDGGHHFGRALGVNLTAIGDAVLADDAHPLQVGIELESAVYEPAVAAFTLKTKDNFGIRMRLVELEPPELKSLDLHWITNQLVLCLNLHN